MIPRLGGPRRDGRGSSFLKLFQYVFHDKQHRTASTRVAWAEAVNCATRGDVRAAWYEMYLTWLGRHHLKLAAGIPLTGRDNRRPVLHLALSWPPGQTPDKADMLEAARQALDWLDLTDHQAVIVAHTDEAHPHLHIVANTVHPLTGLTVNLYQCKKLLSDWALHWEEAHGRIDVPARQTRRQESAGPAPRPHLSHSFTRASEALASAPRKIAPINDNIAALPEQNHAPEPSRIVRFPVRDRAGARPRQPGRLAALFRRASIAGAILGTWLLFSASLLPRLQTRAAAENHGAQPAASEAAAFNRTAKRSAPSLGP